MCVILPHIFTSKVVYIRMRNGMLYVIEYIYERVERITKGETTMRVTKKFY